MSSLALASGIGAWIPLGDPVLVALGGGLVGMSIRNMVESLVSVNEADAVDADGAEDLAGDGGSGLMAEAEPDDGEDLDGLGGLDDDDDLGGFDDGFAEDDGGGGNVDELEHRLEEMETEVGSLSSTVNTVRNENEQISSSVEEVEENVRKLLDIYEMVTRGVNPFADDVDGGMAGGEMGGGGFGLFADEGDQESATIDEDIAEADAEGFFDDDLVEDEESLEADADVGDVLGGDADEPSAAEFDEEFDEEFGDDFDDASDEAGDDSDDDTGAGTSFQDLKEEYESGDADWTEDDDVADAAEAEEDDGANADVAPLEEVDDFADDDILQEVDEDGSEDLAGGEPLDEGGDGTINDLEDVTSAPVADEAAEPDTAGVEPDQGPTAVDDAGPAGAPQSAADSEGSTDSPSTNAGTGRPYLGALPEGVAAELIVVEWLEFLVDDVGVRETTRALEYYESIDWIDETAADDLRGYLSGFDGGGSAALTIDHHTESLQYIGQLNGGGADAIALGRLAHGGGSDGVQR